MGDGMNKTEHLAKKQLEKLFDFIQQPCPTTRWGQKDMFNRWDFICMSKDGDGAIGLFVQVSSVPMYDRGKAYRLKLEEFPCPLGFKKQYWWYKKDKKIFVVKNII